VRMRPQTVNKVTRPISKALNVSMNRAAKRPAREASPQLASCSSSCSMLPKRKLGTESSKAQHRRYAIHKRHWARPSQGVAGFPLLGRSEARGETWLDGVNQRVTNARKWGV
jgi:hypothetical protein